MQQKTQRKIPRADIPNTMESGLNASDQRRVESLNSLARIRGKKARGLERERQRLEDKYGDAGHARIRQVEAKQAGNLGTLNTVRQERNRVETPCRDKAGSDCVAQGHVYDRNGNPVFGAGVALHRMDGTPVEEVADAQTDSKGYFQLRYAGEAVQLAGEIRSADELGNVAMETGAQAGGSTYQNVGARLRGNTGIDKPQGGPAGYLLAYLPDDDSVCAASAPITLRPGRCSYRDLILDFEQKIYQPGEGRRSTRYLGNSASRELHDLNNESPGCRIDRIRFDHTVNFKSPEEALAAGYDYCAYCFGRERSNR